MSTLLAPEPVPVMVRRFECPFCHHRRAAKRAIADHIARCWLNPEVRSCKTCAHFEDVPTGDWCIPGKPCACNDGYVDCRAGLELSAEDAPVTGCPLWAALALEAS